MSRKTRKSLPSLACPLISPNVVGNKKRGLFLPPYSEIDHNNWVGFCISHLHWVGLNSTTYEGPQFEAIIQILHELYHKNLVNLPFSRMKKIHIFELYNQMLKTFEKGQGIRVPLRENKPSNKLRKQWEAIIELKEASDKVEEIYAVRSSLFNALDGGLISHSVKREKEKDYREAYDEFISGYSKAYDEFDCIAKKIGEPAAAALIYHVFETLHPDIAFKHTIRAMHKIDSRDRDFLWNLSHEPWEDAIRQAHDFFNKLTDRLDPDNNFQRDEMRNLGRRVKQYNSYLSKELENDFIKSYYLDPHEYLTSQYWAVYRPLRCAIFSFSVRNDDDEDKSPRQNLSYRPIVLLLETLRQQLTTGIGLFCPFWVDSGLSDTDCCGDRNRELLEKVWSCTNRNSACKRWKRMGCLEK
jgi:hypothetical protein